MMQVYLQTLGCRLNEAELQQWAQGFREAGMGLAAGPESADLIVLNTCAVTGEAARKSRSLLHRLRAQNPAASLVVAGCYASLEGETSLQELGVDLVLTNADKDRLVALIQTGLMPTPARQPAADGDKPVVFQRGRHRAFIKVQDGCRHRCSFCVVTHARGAERSRSIHEIVREINAYATAGIREVVLSGVHLGGYGSDTGEDLTTLLRAVIQGTDIERIRLGSLEPWDLPADFLDLFANPRLMPHLHLPLQSGSDAVLKRMARRCKTADFEALVQEARGQIPDLNVTTDIIVGFPGETETEWQGTLAFVERIGFGHVHVFPYSPRAGTAAARMSGDVPGPVKKERAATLRALAGRMTRETLQAHIGREADVLWEGLTRVDGRSLRQGHTPSHLRVAIRDTRPELENTISRVRASALSEGGGHLLVDA